MRCDVIKDVAEHLHNNQSDMSKHSLLLCFSSVVSTNEITEVYARLQANIEVFNE